MNPIDQLEDKTVTPEGPSRVSLRTRKLVIKKPEYKPEKVELSKNIQKFDSRPQIKNPYDFNTISLKKKIEILPAASDLATIPEYNRAGQILGIDMAHDWNKYYDKVFKIVEMAKKKTGFKGKKLMNWIYQKANHAPSINNKRIEDLYIYLNL